MHVKPKKTPGATKQRSELIAPETPPRNVHLNEVIASSGIPSAVPYVHELQGQLNARFGTQLYFQRQSDMARTMGSPFVAKILEAGQRQLAHAPRTAALIANWSGDPAAAALAMRFNAALHALARRGKPESLKALYLGQHDDVDGAIANALATEDDFIAKAMEHPTQTNEVGRAAALLSALMVLKCQTDMPFELLELGSSGGLNLNLAHYAYDLGGVKAGDPNSPVKIAPEWRGAPPPCSQVEITAARGVDLNPLNTGDPATVERLMSFIWADQPLRLKRLEQALDLALQYPPQIQQGNGATWIVDQLRIPQPEGVCRVVFHSMVLQYFDADDRNIAIDAIHAAGMQATPEQPFAWISFEWTPARTEVRLVLTSWPSGKTRHLANCHPYGAWVEWKA